MPSDEFHAALVAAVPKLRRFSYALAGHMADADDLLQATLERALAKRDLFEDGTELIRWLFRICRNIWIDEMRAKKTRGENIELSEEHGPVADGERAITAAMTLSEVRQAMRGLGDDHRAVIDLVSVEGHSYAEAAAILDIPVGTVMSRLARARAILAEAMGGKGVLQ